jgi:hypothetical protein
MEFCDFMSFGVLLKFVYSFRILIKAGQNNRYFIRRSTNIYVDDQCNGEKLLCKIRSETYETINDLKIAPFTTLQAVGYLVFLEIITIKHLLCILTEVQEVGFAPSM